MTFDLWQTVVHEGGGGLFVPRASRWHQVLADAGHHVGVDRLAQLHEQALANYKRHWRENVQYTTVHATADILDWLEIHPSPALRGALVDAFHDAGLASELLVAPGIEECLASLERLRVPMAIVCDVGLTPASALREHLEVAGLAAPFEVLVFSEDVGRFKPDAAPFEAALDRCRVPPARAAHVGDRRATDVAGAIDAGMLAVRYTGIFDDPPPGPDGDLVIGHHRELLDALSTE